MKTVVKMKFGSHLYGTNTPASDQDFRSVHLPSASDILLGRVEESIKSLAREKSYGEKNTSEDVDNETYALHYFLALAAGGDTGVIDMLYAPDDALIETSDLWELIRANRHRLVSKKSVAFVEYCKSQANKYGIKGSRVAAAEAAAKVFRESCVDHSCKNKIKTIEIKLHGLCREQKHTQIFSKETRPGYEETFFECCDRQVPLTATIETGAKIYEKVVAGYGDRARKARDNDGIDWKAMSHGVRVGYEALELLTTGHVTFPRPEREHLIDIKLGRQHFLVVSEQLENLMTTLEYYAPHSKLPDTVDTAFIEQLVYSEYRKVVLAA